MRKEALIIHTSKYNQPQNKKKHALNMIYYILAVIA